MCMCTIIRKLISDDCVLAYAQQKDAEDDAPKKHKQQISNLCEV